MSAALTAADADFHARRLAGVDLGLLSRHAAAADAAGRLHPEVLALFHTQRWLTLLAPAAVGGGEWPLPDVVRLEEAVAQADGSAGWMLTLCAGAAWFAGFWPEALAQRVLATPGVCLGGSGAATGTAEPLGAGEGDGGGDGGGNGWRLQGHWGHATGAPWATHFTFNAVLPEGCEPRVRAFVVPAAAVQVHDTWQCMGLRASRSDAFSLAGTTVPAEHAFDIAVGAATAPGPLWRFPFGAFAAVTLAANVLGMARAFLAEAEPVVQRRLQQRNAAGAPGVPGVWEAAWAQAVADLQAARDAFYAALDAAWQQAAAGHPVAAEDAQRLEALSHALARAAREAVDGVYPACGLHAADPRTALNRHWRDLHTATQHALWLR